MEKAQIVRYALMQITALVYGILASGAAVRWNRPLAEMGYVMPSGYYHAIFFRDYGIWLMIVAMVWTVIASYTSSPLAKRQVDEGALTISGIAVTVIFFILGSVIAFSGAAQPAELESLVQPVQHSSSP